jgi:hypothetical protein
MVDGGHHVPGLVEAQVQCMEEVWEVLQTGSSSRTVGSTRANDHSSRSHWFVYAVSLSVTCGFESTETLVVWT